MARNSLCAFHSPPRNGDVGICNRREWKKQRGWRNEAERQERCLAVALAADGVHTQDPGRAKSATSTAGRGDASVKARACAHESASAGCDDSGAAGAASACSCGTHQEAGEAQEAGEYKSASGVNATPAVSAIGQLTTADPPNMRQQTDAMIESTEKSLNGINRKLDDQEVQKAAQVREFLKQARDAMTSGDIDGAHTLAIKAKVLLDELHP